MNKIYKIFLVLLLSYFSAEAQISLIAFKAKDGMAFAKGQLTSTFSEGKFVSVASTNSIPNVTLDIAFNLDNGQGKIWVYVFKDKDGNVELVPVLKAPFLGEVNAATLMPSVKDQLAAFMEFIPNEAIGEGEWMDSDQMVTKLNASAEFTAMKTAMPNAALNYITLGLNEINPQLNQNEAYWSVIFQGEEEAFSCAVHAVAGDVTCFQISSVESELSNVNMFDVMPNPVVNSANLKLNDEYDYMNAKVSVYNLAGTKFFSETLNNGADNTAQIDMSMLPKGVYLLILDNESLTTAKVVVKE